MQQDEAIEMQLWDFIDGRCNEQEHQRLKDLIATHKSWKQKFDEITALHQNIGPELEQPSMRFTKNVMDAVTQTHIAPATKKYINISIIRGIAAFFIIIITSILVYALSSANWHSASSDSLAQFNTPDLHLDKLFNSNVIYAFILINIVLGLLLMDSILRKRSIS